MENDFKSVYRRGEIVGYAAGQEAMAKEIIYYIHRHLGPDLNVNTDLTAKEAYQFATMWIELLKAEFLKISGE